MHVNISVHHAGVGRVSGSVCARTLRVYGNNNGLLTAVNVMGNGVAGRFSVGGSIFCTSLL